MLLWVSFAVLTAAVIGLLLRPLRTAERPAVAPADADLAVYRDQLRELDAERERGLIVESEIESARAEVARRLIKRAGETAEQAASSAASAARASRIYLAVAVLLPLASVALYLASGSPHLPGQPFAERQAAPAQETSVANLIGRVEQRLRDHPEDGKGWDVIAPVYLRIGRYADAAHAFAEAIRLEGESVRRLVGFGEATLLAENGVVSEAVRKAALRVRALDPAHIEADVWLALAKEQDGDFAGAAADYRAMLAKGPADAPWREPITERLGLVEKKLGGAPAEAAPPAASSGTPDAAAAAEVAAMPPAEREAFIARMVDGLAARLRDDGRDLDGWIRLARAYKVLGRDDDARAAMERARENFAGDGASLAEIARSAESLGLDLKEQETPQ